MPQDGDGFGGYGRPQRGTRGHSWRCDGRPLAVLEAVENEFDARRDAQLIENFQQIISHDLLAARGASARVVALVCYVATALLGLIGFVGVRANPVYFFILASVGVATLLIAAVRIGALRLERERIQRPKVLTETSHQGRLARRRS